MDLFGSAGAHIVDGIGEDLHKVGGGEDRGRADFGEAVGNGLESLDVFIHFGDESIVWVIEFEQLTAGIERRDGGAKLVGCFFAESRPYSVLFASLRHEEGVDDNQDKEKDDGELYEGEVVELLEQVRVFVVDVLYDIV